MHGACELIEKLGHLDDHGVDLQWRWFVIGDPDFHGLVQFLYDVERRALEKRKNGVKKQRCKKQLILRL